ARLLPFFEDLVSFLLSVQEAPGAVRWVIARPLILSAPGASDALYTCPRPAPAICLCPCLYPTDFSTRAALIGGHCADPRAAYRDQCPADGGQSVCGPSLQLPSRLLPTSLVGLAAQSGVDYFHPRALGAHRAGSSRGRRYRRRASWSQGVWQSPPSRPRALLPHLHGVPLGPQVGRCDCPGAVPLRDPSLGVAGGGRALSFRGLEHQAGPPAQDPVRLEAPTLGSAAPLASSAALSLCGRWQLWDPRLGALCAATLPPSHFGQPVLPVRQSLCAPTATRQGPRGSSPHQRPQAAVATKPGRYCATPSAEGPLVWGHPSHRGSRHPPRPLGQGWRGAGGGSRGVRPRPDRAPSRRILLHHRHANDPSAPERPLYWALVDRNHLGRKSLRSSSGRGLARGGKERDSVAEFCQPPSEAIHDPGSAALVEVVPP